MTSGLDLDRRLDEYERSYYFYPMGKGAETRETILDVASRRAAVVGLEGLTFGDLARELALSKSGLYAHFRSKEALQVEVLDREAGIFTDTVVRVALKAARGEPRVRALFEGWLGWMHSKKDTGCLFAAAAAELDDRPGPVRDRLVEQQRDLAELFVGVVRTAVNEGAFRADLDPEQFAFEAHGFILIFHHDSRLLHAKRALERAHRGFDRLVADAQPS